MKYQLHWYCLLLLIGTGCSSLKTKKSSVDKLVAIELNQDYGPRVARALKVNFIMSSVSGIGVYRNWNNDGPAMPAIYEKVDFRSNSSQAWDFSRYTPQSFL